MRTSARERPQAPYFGGHPLGLLIACRVEPADISDRKAAALLLCGLRPLFPNIRTVIADAGHQSQARAPPAVPGRLEAADSQTSAARVQDHRPHLDCGAQLRLAWPKSTIEQGLRVTACRALRHSSKSPQHALCSIASLRHEPF